jgi:hypothetical protein
MIEYAIIVSSKIFIHFLLFFSIKKWWLIRDKDTLRLNKPLLLPRSIPQDARLIFRWMLITILFASFGLITQHFLKIVSVLCAITLLSVLYKIKQKVNRITQTKKKRNYC